MSAITKVLNSFGATRKRSKFLVFVGLLLWMFVFMTAFQNRSRIARAVIDQKPWTSLADVFPASVRAPANEDNSGLLGGTRSSSSSHGNEHSSYGHCESDDFRHVHGNVDKTSLHYFTDAFQLTEDPVRSWLTRVSVFCNDKIKLYDNKFGLLQDVKINPRERNNVDGLAKGGEGVQDVKSQNINKEDYVFKPGFFEIACKDGATGIAGQNGFDKVKQLKVVDNMAASSKTEEKFTIAIARGDYANLWNHMFELYGVFVLMMVFNKQPEDVSVLFLDGHPSCLLDKNWDHIFGPVQRVGRFEEPVLYKNLVWGLPEYQIPLSKWENPGCPYVEEFRSFVLNQYGIVENAKKLNCKKLTFTFIVRRNQVYHPRNLEGNVQRKIFNELEVIETLMDRFPGVCIQALLMESIPMRAQLEIVSESDVLIGMHGAGMMHVSFLPRHAGVVELFPRDWRKTRKHAIMYEKMTMKWRGMQYGAWENPDPKRAFDERVTIVDVDKVYEQVKGVIDKMCKPS